MPRARLNITDAERTERYLKKAREYYYKKKALKTQETQETPKPPKPPRKQKIPVELTVEEMKAHFQKKKEYYKKYYEDHKEYLMKKATEYYENKKATVDSSES